MWNKPFPIVRPLILVLLYLLWDAQWVQTEPAKERPGQNPSCGWFILDECQPVWEEWSFSVATVTLIMSTFQICESGKPSFLLEKGAVLSPHITTSAFQTHNDFEASTAKDRLVEECFHLSTPGEENNNVWHFYSMLTEKVHRHHLHWLLAQQTLSPHRPNQNTPCIKNTVCLNTCSFFWEEERRGYVDPQMVQDHWDDGCRPQQVFQRAHWLQVLVCSQHSQISATSSSSCLSHYQDPWVLGLTSRVWRWQDLHCLPPSPTRLT